MHCSILSGGSSRYGNLGSVVLRSRDERSKLDKSGEQIHRQYLRSIKMLPVLVYRRESAVTYWLSDTIAVNKQAAVVMAALTTWTWYPKRLQKALMAPKSPTFR
jgi:hypothetical protein